MTTVYIINSLEGGGAERVFVQLIELLAGDNSKTEETHVVLLDMAVEAYTLPENVKVHRIGRGAGFIGGGLQFYRLLKVLKRLRPALIVSFLTRANIMSVLSAKLLGSRSIISERSNTSGRLSNRFVKVKRFLVSMLYRRADLIIAVSKGVADCLVGEFNVAREQLAVLNNPVDFERINALALSGASTAIPCGVVAMGRLVKSKGFDDLLCAYAQSGLSCGLTILGDGPERVNLQALASDLDISSDVRFLGFVTNPYQEIQRAELFVLCSHLEGFPNALLEAMALGKAVIATDCADGPREILSLEETIPGGEHKQANFGLMVNVGDSLAMANALRHLHSSVALRDELAGKARDRVQQFSTQNFYATFSNLVAQANQVNSRHAKYV